MSSPTFLKRNTNFSLSPRQTDWKIQMNHNLPRKEERQFIDRVTFSEGRSNPFLEIESMANQYQQNKKEFIEELDFSVIQLKSPTYSEMFNSLTNQEKYFPKNNHHPSSNQKYTDKQPSHILIEDQNHYRYQQRQQKDKNQKLFLNKTTKFDRPSKFLELQEPRFIKNPLKDQNHQWKDIQVDRVPSFFIKIPQETLRAKQSDRRKTKKNMTAELEEIYNGKYKISLGRCFNEK